MRKAKIIVVLGLMLACATLAIGGGIEVHRLTISTGDDAFGETTNVFIRGYVEEIYFDAPAATTTGDLTVTWSPELATMDPITIATATALTSDLIIRPRVDGTDTAGNAVTNNPPGRYLVGSTIKYAVTNASATNLTWTCIIKTNDQ